MTRPRTGTLANLNLHKRLAAQPLPAHVISNYVGGSNRDVSLMFSRICG